MSENSNLKIELEGEKEFKKSINVKAVCQSRRLYGRGALLFIAALLLLFSL